MRGRRLDSDSRLKPSGLTDNTKAGGKYGEIRNVNDESIAPPEHFYIPFKNHACSCPNALPNSPSILPEKPPTPFLPNASQLATYNEWHKGSASTSKNVWAETLRARHFMEARAAERLDAGQERVRGGRPIRDATLQEESLPGSHLQPRTRYE